MSEWKEYKLNDLVTKLGDGLHGTPKYDPEGDYYFINGSNLIDGKISVNDNTKRVSKAEFDKYKKELSDRTIFVSINGTLGNIATYNNEKIILGKSACYFNVKDGVCKEFIKYIATDKSFQHYISEYATGSTIKNVPLKTIRDYTLKLPSLPTQTAIAEILSSLDDKIELNNKINQELENLAQTLFKRWFIDFEFPNENGDPYKSSGGEMVESELGEIPKGWEIDSLDNIAEFLNGLALQKFPAESDYEFLPVIKIRELRQKDTSNSDKTSVNLPEKYIIEDGDVLFSWSGSLMIDFWTNGKGALNQHLFKVTSKEYPKWYYYLWTKHHLTEFIAIAESKATTMGHIQRQHLTNAKVLVPNGDIITNFSLVFEPIISKIIDNRIECVELIKLRDTLLPKLISGELEVADVTADNKI
jgi:type I restriction enzyme S subunit